jgi:hypothetical protein
MKAPAAGDGQLRALSVYQPVGWAMVTPHPHQKRVENRMWPPPRAFRNSLFPLELAIHAGATWDTDYETFVRGALGHPPDWAFPAAARVSGAIIGVAVVDGCVYSHDRAEGAAQVEASPGWEGQGRWFIGPYGWLLRDIIAIDPLPCRGFQKLWRLPAEVELEVRRRARAAAAPALPATP